MNQELVKNISIISQLLEVGDEDTLALLLSKTKMSDTKEQFKYLWNALENKRFDDAQMLIKDIERQARQLSIHYDPIISALKVELHFQESDLAFLIADRDELAQKIEQFQIRYHSVVRVHFKELLLLRKDKLAIQASMDPRMKDLAETAQSEYEAFDENFNASIKGLLYSLTPEEDIELKRLYRSASMICHPDRVADEYKEKAEAMFAELHESYINNDIKKVRLICELLVKTGQFEPLTNRLETSDAIRARINWVLIQSDTIKSEISEIQASEVYFTVQSIGSEWSAYLKGVVDNFKLQIEDLKKWHLLHAHKN